DIRSDRELIKEEFCQVDTTVSGFEYEYEYEYDEHDNIICETKKGKDSLFGESESRIFYKNSYIDNHLVESIITTSDGRELNKNLFFYDDKENKLTRIERYGKTDETFQLFQTEYVVFNDNIIEKTVRLPNGVLAYYDIIEVNGNEIIKRYLLNPVKGDYYWYVGSLDEHRCYICVSEEVLTVNIFREMLDYALTLKKSDNRMHVITDAPVIWPDKEIGEVEESFKKMGLDVSFIS
ncbi:MAG: hypothetical protein FWD01_04795, partial [Defluviitaleaceae bacterium]|nr:hypothetical protein [Defluviitaleaceae bacterium]